MRKRLPGVRALTGVAVAGGLVFAGIAIALPGPASTKSVSATFAATKVTDLKSSTCTGADGAYTVTNATYSGDSSSSDSRLDGKIELRVKSIYNTDKSLGWLEANVKVAGAGADEKAHGKLHAVNKGGQLQGLLTGGVHGPDGKLLGNVSAGFTSGGGFTDGKLGTGGADNTAIVHSGACKPPKAPKSPKTAKPAPKSPKTAKAPKAPRKH